MAHIKKVYAFVTDSGAIQFDYQEPVRHVAIAVGAELEVKEKISRTARRDGNGNYFVPGMQEAYGDCQQTESYVALARYINHLGTFRTLNFRPIGA